MKNFFERFRFFVAVLWDTIKDMYDEYIVKGNDTDPVLAHADKPFKSVILTEGWMEGPGWVEVDRRVIGGELYIINEVIRNEVKEVRWFLLKDGRTSCVSKKDVERILSC